MTEFENQYIEMEKHFESMQQQNTKKMVEIQKENEKKLFEKGAQLEHLLEELRKCQYSMNQQRKVEQPEQVQDLEKKNNAELQAELDFYRQQSESLEQELKAMDLELHVYRKQNNETRLMQDQILHLESQNMQMK